MNGVIPGLLVAAGISLMTGSALGIWKYRLRDQGPHAGDLSNSKLTERIRREAEAGAVQSAVINEQRNDIRRQRGYLSHGVGIHDKYDDEVTKIMKERE